MALPSNAWAQARDRFLEDLEEPEREMFAKASLENLFYSASAAQKIHEEKSRSRYLASKLDSLLAGIDQYGKAMDVFSQASPFLCPLWGALRVIIHLSSQFQRYFTVLIDMFEQIGDVIPRFQAYETIFSSSPRLTQSLSNAYLDVAKFCTSAKTAFQKARRSVVNAKMLFRLSWQSVEQQFGTLMKDFRRHRKSVEKEAELAHLIEADRARAVERVNTEQQYKATSEFERIRLLSLLSSVQWEQQHYRILDMKHTGTGTWVLTTDVFKRWKSAIETHQHRCLWCYGIPGSGKTILAASVIKSLSQEVDHQHSVVAYFYCDYADSETLDASVILGTITQQLLIGRQSIEEAIAAKIREAYGNGMRRASPHDLIKIVEFIIRNYYDYVYIILDGIDETSPDIQGNLFSGLAKLSVSCSTLLRLYISTRETTLVPHHFPSCLRFDISESRASEDIECYIKASVQQRLHCLPILSSYPYLETRVVHELTMKAQGLFLRVSLQIEELCDPSHSRRSFILALQDLPEGLTATYERIYQKIARRSLRQRSLAKRILDWTLCARRPLKFIELKDAVAVDLHDVSWDREKISAETNEKRFLHVCGNLVIFHERDSTVRLAHHTVGKFLEQHKIDRSQTDATIGGVCLTYLGFSDFTTQVTSVREKQEIFGVPALRQAGFYRIPQVLGFSNFVYNFIVGLYNRNNKWSLPDVNYAELVRRYQKKPLSESLSQKYYLLDYITTNWIWHTTMFDPKYSAHWRKFEELVFHTALPFDFKPWGTLEGPTSLPHLGPYLWALENNHLPLLLLLRDHPEPRSLRSYVRYKTLRRDRVPPRGLTHSARSSAVDSCGQPDSYDWPVMKVLFEGTAEVRDLCLQADPSIISYHHIMTRALKDSNFGLITSLLRGGATLQKKEIDDRHALFEASRRGNQDLVNMLLDLGADVNLRLFQDERGWTPLCDAIMNETSVSNGNREPHTENATSCPPLDMIQLLLDRGADPNAKQAGGETVLHRAIGLGETYVQLLLSRGADVDARNDQQQSILDLALDTSSRMIDLVVENGVDLEARDPEGRTALLKAVQKQYGADRVKTLIRHGADIHAKDTGGQTVLHHLCSSTDGILQHFLELGVDVNAKDANGATPLDFAVRQMDNVKIELLLILGGIPGNNSSTGRTVLHDLHRSTHNILQRLLNLGLDLNARDDSGATPLDLAVRQSDNVKFWSLYRLGGIPGEQSAPPLTEAVAHGNSELVHFLLGTKSDPNLLGNSQKTAISSAVERKDREIVSALLKAGADPNLEDRTMVSPLARAMLNKDKEIGQLLIEAGAVIQPPSGVAYSPLLIAVKSGEVSMVEFLIQHGADVSSFRFSDLRLRATHTKMCDFLTRLRVPFEVFNDEYED